VQRIGTDVTISFATVAGQRYRVEQADSFAARSWSTLADNLGGTGAQMTITDYGATARGQRCYRVVVLP
jgi:hypothetical protein